MNYADSAECDLNIRKNNNQIAVIFNSNRPNTINSITISPILVNVAQNDIIYLGINKATSGSLTLLPDNYATNLTVEVVE